MNAPIVLVAAEPPITKVKSTKSAAVQVNTAVLQGFVKVTVNSSVAEEEEAVEVDVTLRVQMTVSKLVDVA